MGLLTNEGLGIGLPTATTDKSRTSWKISIVTKVSDLGPHGQLFYILTEPVIHHTYLIHDPRLPRGTCIGGGICSKLKVDLVIDEMAKVQDHGKKDEHERENKRKEDGDLSPLIVYACSHRANP